MNKCELWLSIAIQQPSTELMSYFICCQDWIKQIIANNIMVNSKPLQCIPNISECKRFMLGAIKYGEVTPVN